KEAACGGLNRRNETMNATGTEWHIFSSSMFHTLLWSTSARVLTIPHKPWVFASYVGFQEIRCVEPGLPHRPLADHGARHLAGALQDRKSTRLNSSHGSISYAVFCLKKKRNY